MISGMLVQRSGDLPLLFPGRLARDSLEGQSVHVHRRPLSRHRNAGGRRRLALFAVKRVFAVWL